MKNFWKEKLWVINLLPVLLSFEGKKVAVFGCGSVGKRRAKKILKNGGIVI